MLKNLVIVESPAKAQTIEKFLGKDYKVMSSYGHIRDLKSKEFSIDLETFSPEYVIPEDKSEIVKKLKSLAKEAETVWLASDEDREGEAISWHLYEVLALTPEKTKRIVFHEITKSAILNAIEAPRQRPAGTSCARPYCGFQTIPSVVEENQAIAFGRSRTVCGSQVDCGA